MSTPPEGEGDSKVFFLNSPKTDFHNMTEFHDVVLKATDGSVNAHKLILASSSKFFNEALKTTSGDPGTCVTISNAKKSVLEKAVQAIYAGSVSVPRDEEEEFLSLAERIQINCGITSASDERSCPSTNSSTGGGYIRVKKEEDLKGMMFPDPDLNYEFGGGGDVELGIVTEENLGEVMKTKVTTNGSQSVCLLCMCKMHPGSVRRHLKTKHITDPRSYVCPGCGPASRKYRGLVTFKTHVAAKHEDLKGIEYEKCNVMNIL